MEVLYLMRSFVYVCSWNIIESNAIVSHKKDNLKVNGINGSHQKKHQFAVVRLNKRVTRYAIQNPKQAGNINTVFIEINSFLFPKSKTEKRSARHFYMSIM